MQAIAVHKSDRNILPSNNEIKHHNRMALSGQRRSIRKRRHFGSRLFTKNDIRGVNISELPNAEKSYVLSRIKHSPSSTRLRGNTRGVYEKLKTDLYFNTDGSTPSNSKKLIVKDTKGDPVLLRDHQLDNDYRVLKPLKKVMKIGLKSIGINPSDNLSILSEQFYNNVIRPSKQTGVMNFKKDYPAINTSQMTDDHADNAKSAIVDSILVFFKTARTKQQAGKKLTKIEKIMADGTNVVEQNLKQSAKDEAGKELGKQILFSRKTQLIIAASLFAAIFIGVKVMK